MHILLFWCTLAPPLPSPIYSHVTFKIEEDKNKKLCLLKHGTENEKKNESRLRWEKKLFFNSNWKKIKMFTILLLIFFLLQQQPQQQRAQTNKRAIFFPFN
jgi:hypothetical protein